jgi:hypothetical protein
MKYLMIPIKNEKEGIEISDSVFGSMMWDDTEYGKLKAYPSDTENPVIITDKSYIAQFGEKNEY